MEAVINLVAQHGPMGAVCAALLLVVVWLVKIVTGRETDMVEVIKENSVAIQRLTDVLDTLGTEQKDDHNRFQNLQQKTYNQLISRPCQKGSD